MLRNLLRDSSSSDSDDNSREKCLKKQKKKIKFRCGVYAKPEASNNNSLFVVDTSEVNTEKQVDANRLDEDSVPFAAPVVDKEIETILEKSVIKSGFDQKHPDEIIAKSLRQLKKDRKVQREKTKGQNWFDLPATELTEERQRDLELIKMRDSLDPKAHYRKGSDNLPKYFQMGRIVESKADFYSSRMTKKQRKRTMVEEILHDQAILTKNKRRYSEIKAREATTKRGTYQRRNGLSKRSKYKKERK